MGFDDVTSQGLAHYCGNITYHLPVQTRGGKVTVKVHHYSGTAIRLELAGQQQYIVYPPYQAELDHIPAGAHTLNLTLLGNRQNGFGPIHRADLKDNWTGPNAWRTTGSSWTESYRLTQLGILSAPEILETVTE